MRKIFQTFLMLVIFTVFLGAGYAIQRCATMPKSGLIETVLALGSPIPGKGKSINEIVIKYVPVGTSRKKAEEILFSAGFRLREQKLTPLLEQQTVYCDDFKDCEEVVLGASHTRHRWLSIVRDEIVIKIGFKKNRASVFRARYFTDGFL